MIAQAFFLRKQVGFTTAEVCLQRKKADSAVKQT